MLRPWLPSETLEAISRLWPLPPCIMSRKTSGCVGSGSFAGGCWSMGGLERGKGGSTARASTLSPSGAPPAATSDDASARGASTIVTSPGASALAPSATALPCAAAPCAAAACDAPLAPLASAPTMDCGIAVVGGGTAVVGCSAAVAGSSRALWRCCRLHCCSFLSWSSSAISWHVLPRPISSAKMPPRAASAAAARSEASPLSSWR